MCCASLVGRRHDHQSIYNEHVSSRVHLRTHPVPPTCVYLLCTGSEADVWWGGASPNFPMTEDTFCINRHRAAGYLNSVDRLYVVDGYVNWKESVRVRICTKEVLPVVCAHR